MVGTGRPYIHTLAEQNQSGKHRLPFRTRGTTYIIGWGSFYHMTSHDITKSICFLHTAVLYGCRAGLQYCPECKVLVYTKVPAFLCCVWYMCTFTWWSTPCTPHTTCVQSCGGPLPVLLTQLVCSHVVLHSLYSSHNLCAVMW